MVDPADLTQAPDAGGSIETDKDARLFGMLSHLLAVFTGFIGPLVIWLLKKDSSPFVDDQGKEALNFQITVFILMFVSGLLVFVVIGLFLIYAVWLADLVLCIIATIKANSGIRYRYPFAIRLIK